MGHVQLIDHMGSDSAIVQSARVSYGAGTKAVSDDRALIRYLMRHWHSTPFEMVEFKFLIKCPIFVARQWMRHRTASINEISARYSVIPSDFFVPEYRKQSKTNKQGSGEPLEVDDLAVKVEQSCCDAFEMYNDLLDEGCARELARCHLPQSTYTEFYWKINLHNLFHFLKLRMDLHAQKEIQDYATHVYELIKPIVPMACEAFEDFRLGGMNLTRLEVASLGNGETHVPGKGENQEFQDKLKLLGFS